MRGRGVEGNGGKSGAGSSGVRGSTWGGKSYPALTSSFRQTKVEDSGALPTFPPRTS